MKRYIKEWIRAELAKRNILVRGCLPTWISGTIFERDLRILLPQEDPICLDVGANMGQTIELLQHIFSSPHIYAFEPSSTTFAHLQAKPHGERVRLFNMALGAQEAEQDFINYLDPTLSSFLELDPNEGNAVRDTPTISTERVKVQTVDNFLATHAIPHVDLLKIDTQGYDYQVLRGANDSFQRGIIQTVLVELIFFNLYKQQNSTTQIIDFLASHGLYLVDLYEKHRDEPKHTMLWCNGLFARQ